MDVSSQMVASLLVAPLLIASLLPLIARIFLAHPPVDFERGSPLVQSNLHCRI
jgi:hypothetical protein